MSLPPSRNSLQRIVDARDLLARWKIILATTLCAVSCTAIYLIFAKKTYEAQVRIVLQKVELPLDGRTRNKTYDKEFLLTQAETLRSPLVVLDSLQQLATPVGFEAESPQSIDEALRVNPLAGTDIIRVSYQFPNAHHATQRLQAIIGSYERQLEDSMQQQAETTRDLLKQKHTELLEELDSLQVELQPVSVGSTEADLGNLVSYDRTLLSELTTQWARIRSERIRLQARIESTRASDDASTTSVSQSLGESSPVLRDLSSRLNIARIKQKQIEHLYEHRHIAHQQMKHEIEQLESEYKQFQGKLEQADRDALAELMQQEQAIEKLISAERQNFVNLESRITKDQQQEERVKHVRDLLAENAAKLESADLACRALVEGELPIVVRILDDFLVPDEPVWPKPIPLLGVSAVLGGLTGIGLLLAQGIGFPSSLVRQRDSSTVDELAGA